MIPLPPECAGCPFSSISKYFTPDKVVEGSEVFLLAQAPGAHEENGKFLTGYEYYGGVRHEKVFSVDPQPLIGATGKWLQEEFFPLTKLDYSKVSKGNVLKCRPYGSNDLPNIGSNKTVNGITVTRLKEAISFCTRTHLRIPSSTKHILAMGEISLYHLTGEELLNYKAELSDDGEPRKSTITEWRGWVLGKEKNGSALQGLTDYFDCSTRSNTTYNIYPVVHVASLFQNPRLYHATLLDFLKFGKLVRGEWPEKVPEFKVNYIPSTIPSTIGFDTEYTQSNELTMWSMADVEGNIYVVDAEYSKLLQNLPEELMLVTQNGLVDLPHFLPLVPKGRVKKLLLEDCMLLHSVLWSNERHSLDYMLSKYGGLNRHKHLREVEDRELKHFYAAIDAHGTLNYVWKGLLKDAVEDKRAWAEYRLRRQPLLYPIRRYQERGVKVDQERVLLVKGLLDRELEEIHREAREVVGVEEFNIQSVKQVGAFLYTGEVSRKQKARKVSKKHKEDSSILI